MSTVELPSPLASRATDPMLPMWHRVERIRRENHDTFTLELAACEGDTDFAFAPGQFNMLYVFGVGEVPISISGDPSRTDRIVHTIRAVGTVTRAIQRLRRGDTVGLRGPYGSSWPTERAEGRDLVIVAGGIGLAPLRPAIYEVMRHRDRFERVALLYGARTPDDLLYADEFLTPAVPLNIDVRSTVDRAVTRWQGKVGVVTTLIPSEPFDPIRAIALVCGPEMMMRFTVKALTGLGMTKDRIHVSMERNMKCAVGFCGHCQYGPKFICKDGPVFRFDEIEHLFGIREL